ncbi:MAG: dienelactone hydrolase family protein [Candidatus Limnocylindrales bacterium]
MCHDLDSRPPIPPLAGAAVDGKRIELESADRTRFLAFDAQAADSPARTGIVILPDVRGLHRFYEELALRFAERGMDAVAIDYFGRTARSADRGDRFEAMPHVEQTRYEMLMMDVKAARDHLVSRGTPHVSSIGFCFGGRLAFLTGTRPEFDLAGVIGFYGGPTGPGRGGMPAPLDVALADKFRAPVLGLFGGADKGIPEESIGAFGGALTGAGIENELVIYPGAPHSFFDRKAADFADAAADSWVKVLEFVERNSPTS